MSIAELVIVAIGLAMDAFAVSISDALVYSTESSRRLMTLPVAFGIFQGGMAALGYLLSGIAAELVEAYSGIIALVILALIGGSMVKDGIKNAERPSDIVETAPGARLSASVVLLQAVATAIDAFAVGVSLRALDVGFWISTTLIGAVTFGVCVVAISIGRRIGGALGWKAEIGGGVILILIGFRAFF